MALLLAVAPAASAHLRGELDRSFGHGGRVLFGTGPTYANSSYGAVARQEDGSLVFAGRTESVQGKYIEPAVLVQRRLPDGRLDPSFHPVVDDDVGYGPVGLALEANGDILYATQDDDYSGQVHRLNPNGTPDTSYGKDGSVELPFDPAFLAVDSEGRTVVSGTAGIGGNCHDCLPTPVPAVARLVPNGTLDQSFGKGGILLASGEGALGGGATGLVSEHDDSIVVANSGHLFGVTAEGTLDTAFGHEGTVAVNGSIGALTETTSGDVVTAASVGPYEERGPFTLKAYRADGNPDSDWGDGGKLTIQVAEVDEPTALAPGPDGTLFFAGEAAVADQEKGCRECSYEPYLARIDADGTVDPTFSTSLGGLADQYRAVGPFRGSSGRIGAIVALPNGDLVLAGPPDPDDSFGEQATARELSSSGSTDTGFGTGGSAADPEPLPSDTQAEALAVGPHGSFVTSYYSNVGSYSSHGALGAWDSNGERVEGYGGAAELSYGDPATVLETDGRGRLYRIEQHEDFVRRFGVDGQLDSGYGSGGSAQLPSRFDAKALIVRRNGEALVVGHIAGREAMALFELTPAGRADLGFGKGGLVLVREKKKKTTALSAAYDGHGRIVFFGLVGRQTPLVRLLPDGRLDRSFGRDGRINFKPELAVGDSSVSVARDGRIYLATSPEDGGETTLVRFRPDGAVDPSFGTDGVVRIDKAPALLRFFVSGRRLVLVSGTGHYDRTGLALRAFRLDGNLDRTFADDGVFEGGSGVTADFGAVGAVREPDGDIVVAGTHRPHSYGEELELVRFR